MLALDLADRLPEDLSRVRVEVLHVDLAWLRPPVQAGTVDQDVCPVLDQSFRRQPSWYVVKTGSLAAWAPLGLEQCTPLSHNGRDVLLHLVAREVLQKGWRRTSLEVAHHVVAGRLQHVRLRLIVGERHGHADRSVSWVAGVPVDRLEKGGARIGRRITDL